MLSNFLVTTVWHILLLIYPASIHDGQRRANE